MGKEETDKKASILIVDDDESTCRTLALTLNKAGYETEIAGTGSQALEKAGTKPFNAVLLDIKLPDIEGIELLEPLNEKYPDTAVIMITAYASVETAVEALNKGAWAYITKPLNLDELLHTTLKHAIEKQRLLEEKRRMEKALQESEQKYRSIFEESKDTIFIATPAGKFVDINPAGVELFGYSSKDELLNPDIAEDLYFDHQDREEYLQTLNEFGYVTDYELNLQKKDGTKIVALVNTQAVYDENGDIVAYRGILRDITEQRQLQEQLYQAQKMEAIGRLAGGVAHDFNNLLTVIGGNLELALMTMSEENPLKEKLYTIQKASDSAANLTRQLLTFSRKQVMELRLINPSDVLNNLEKMLRRLISEDIELTMKLQPDVGLVRADVGQIEQVLVNLAVNAREAMPAGGSLLITTERVILDEEHVNKHPLTRPGLHVMLSVSDTGFGMDKDTIEKVFEPFFTTKEEGTGLGLATVYGIVKQHEGSIDIYSEEALGTTFKIYLPVVEEATEASYIDEIETTMPRGHETILLVEDEEGVRDLATGILGDLGYTVHSFSRAIEAEQFCRDHEGTIDLLLTDIIMPGISGPELAGNLKAQYPSTPILFMSGYPGDAIRLHEILDEKADFLSKPFTPSNLARKVREVIDGLSMRNGQSS